ncbi:MAG: hypothetical protein J5922_02580 [Clostridia bacterium]|nr:hypothetical protein [Clostridia bacterium]
MKEKIKTVFKKAFDGTNRKTFLFLKITVGMILCLMFLSVICIENVFVFYEVQRKLFASLCLVFAIFCLSNLIYID